MIGKYILTWKEFLKELKMSYWQLVDYLNKKYGRIEYDYTSGKRESIKGLFIHHTMEWVVGDLSSACGVASYPQYQLGKYLVLCNWLEHLLLHAKIFTEWNAPRKGQMDNGALNFILPQLYAYLEFGLKATSYGQAYYDNINNKSAIRILKKIVSLFNLEYSNGYIIRNVIKPAEANFEADHDNQKCDSYMQIISFIWSNTEIKLLKRYYHNHSNQEMADILYRHNGGIPRSCSAVQSKAMKLNLKCDVAWTPEDEQILRDNINLSNDELAKLMPKFTKSAIIHKKSRLRLVKEITRWTEDEYNVIYDNMDNLIRAYELLSYRSPQSVKSQINRLRSKTRKEGTL